MKFYLDGSDWEADYFITQKEFESWTNNLWNIKKMYLDILYDRDCSDHINCFTQNKKDVSKIFNTIKYQTNYSRP